MLIAWAFVKRDFLTAVAHELRTPTMIIKGYAQRLRKVANLSTDEAQALSAMERASKRIERLTESIVDLSAITLGRIVLSMEHADLADLALQAINSAPGASTHTVHFVPSLPAARVFVDPLRMRRVVAELIENAARCSSAGSEIDVEIRVEGQKAMLSVRDHGVGISREARDRIFEPFFHAHSGSPNDVGGLGLGLFLAREIVLRHGGAIAFESPHGRGTTFTVTLPLDTEGP